MILALNFFLYNQAITYDTAQDFASFKQAGIRFAPLAQTIF